MKCLFYLFAILIMLSCTSLHDTSKNADVYGTYFFFDENKRETIPTWTKIDLLPTGSFVYTVPYMNKGKEVYGKWQRSNDTLYLTTEYTHFDVNFVDKKIKDSCDDIHVTVKVYNYDDIDLSDFLLAIIVDSVQCVNDTVTNLFYYNVETNSEVTIPFNLIVRARGIALIDKRGHFVEYYGSMKEHLKHIQRGYHYDLIFMGWANYPVLLNEPYLYKSDTLVYIFKVNDSTIYHIKFVKHQR